MCRWMESHFHDWIDYNGVAFSIELLEWGRIFSGFPGVRIFWQGGIWGITNIGRFAVQIREYAFYIQFNKCVNSI